jgi:hypothetical protein
MLQGTQIGITNLRVTKKKKIYKKGMIGKMSQSK